jgi:hypothetical protein
MLRELVLGMYEKEQKEQKTGNYGVTLKMGTESAKLVQNTIHELPPIENKFQGIEQLQCLYPENEQRV